MADLIENKHDAMALQSAAQDAVACLQITTAIQNTSYSTARQAAERALAAGDYASRISLDVLNKVVRRMAAMPGQRNVVLVSPGFITPFLERDYMDIIDLAVHSQVVISALDARGLYTIDPLGDISDSGRANLASLNSHSQYDHQEAIAVSDLPSILASSTGGTFFQNSNDMAEGFRRVATAPEFWYTLGFAPPNLKPDGSFHSLKVTLRSPQKLALQARHGYFAPKSFADPAEQAKQEIEDALFSQEEVHDLPVELHTQFFKASEDDARLTVLAHVDVKRLHFRKAEGRNQNVLTMVSGIFNRDGNYLQGTEKIVTMHLKDDTLERKLQSGVTLKTSFDVKPGSYLVRLVVRDAEGQLSAESGAIEIP